MGPGRQSNHTGFIDPEGNLAILLPTAIEGGAFTEGFARVVIREWSITEDPSSIGTYGPFIFIDRSGNDAFGKEFSSGADFRGGFARVMQDWHWFFIDRTGANAFDMYFDFALDFNEAGYAKVKLLDGTDTIIDRYGNFHD